MHFQKFATSEKRGQLSFPASTDPAQLPLQNYFQQLWLKLSWASVMEEFISLPQKTWFLNCHGFIMTRSKQSWTARRLHMLLTEHTWGPQSHPNSIAILCLNSTETDYLVDFQKRHYKYCVCVFINTAFLQQEVLTSVTVSLRGSSCVFWRAA